MISDSKNSIALGYALTYAVGISAYNAISTMGAIGSSSADTNDSRAIAFIAATHFASVLSYALSFVLLAVILDFLTKRSPQPMNALSLSLVAFATIDLLLQAYYLSWKVTQH